MRNLLLLLLLVLIGAGVYGYINNPAVCRKLGTDVAADLTTIFTPGSGSAPGAASVATAPAVPDGKPASAPTVAKADAPPRHWQQGFVATTDSAPTDSAATEAAPAPTPGAPSAPVGKFTEYTNYDMALSEARTENKPLLILSGLDWSTPSQILQAQTISQAAFQRYSAAHFVFLDLDYPHELASDDGALNPSDDKNALSTPRDDSDLTLLKETMQKYGVGAVPTIVVVNANEQELGRLSGGSGGGPSGLISKLEKILHP